MNERRVAEPVREGEVYELLRRAAKALGFRFRQRETAQLWKVLETMYRDDRIPNPEEVAQWRFERILEDLAIGGHTLRGVLGEDIIDFCLNAIREEGPSSSKADGALRSKKMKARKKRRR